MKASYGVIVLLVCCAASFQTGRLYEAHTWGIASTAIRAAWGAKEGPLEDRLLNANRAIKLDDEYLLAYVLKARAWFEAERQDSPEHIIPILHRGMDATEADQALYLLWRASLQQNDTKNADVYLKCLLRVGGDWAVHALEYMDYMDEAPATSVTPSTN